MTNATGLLRSLGIMLVALLISTPVNAALITGFTIEATGTVAPGPSYLRSFDASGAIISGPIDLGIGVYGLTVGPSDSLYAFKNSGPDMGLLRIDASTGQTTALGSSIFLQSIDYNPANNTLYGIGGAAGADKQLYSFDLTSGNANRIATLTGLTNAFDVQRLAIRSDGVAYLASLSSTEVSFGTLSLTTAEFQRLGTTSNVGEFGDLAFDSADDLFQLSGGKLFRVDQSTFAKTNVSSVAGGAGLAFAATSVPEPSLAGLLGTATAWIFCVGRFRKNAWGRESDKP
ncbi:hypothetical protein [Novipirellula caenicola]|uniref:DUF4394 domain-containing protein n=1 Tax=Novipirellula caenicola TaxID=1536901 RepID=A0ABP9VPI8_9BACT